MKQKVWIIPHSHYDAEVFIVEAQTLEIGFANLIGALRLMRADPSYKFALDQTCLIEPFLRTYPEEREFFEEMIHAGRLDIVGGTVIMPDVNIPSGESFIRQVYYGKRYLEKELGLDVRTSWTIDTFGRHPQMPQLTVKCGFDQDAFQRLMFKDGPSEFYWQGLDGTRLFCHWMHVSYACFYGVPGNLHEFRKFAAQRIERLASRAVTQHLMAPAGADLTPADTALPAMVRAYNRDQADSELVIATPAEYFPVVKAAGTFPVVTADLNPAFQGCNSARIDIKQWNRKLETILSNCEKYEALGQRLGTAPRAAQIDAAWQGVLFNQFHDIICGSHVDAVFHNTMDRFKASLVQAEANLAASLEAIAAQIDTQGNGAPLVVFNPLNWQRSDVLEVSMAFSDEEHFELAVEDSHGRRMDSELLSVERNSNGSIARARLFFIARDVPAFGYETFHVIPVLTQPAAGDLATSHPQGGLLRFELDKGWMENQYYRLEIDLWSGLITRLYDKVNGWEVLSPQRPLGNSLVKERDYGNFWQYNGPCKGDEFYPVEGRYPLPAQNDTDVDFAHTYLGDGYIRQGSAMAEFTINHPYGSGQYATRVRLYAGLPRIDIQTSLINQDERVRYRAAFPTSIQSGTITHEIPFGAIQRPEGEFPAQNWLDYSDDSHGLTLLNRGLPGNNVADGVMMLALLKCTALKEGYAEVGGFKLSTATEEGYEKGVNHVFEYGLVAHEGDWRAAQAYRRGLEYNNPLLVFKPGKHPGSLPPSTTFLHVHGGTVVLSAVRSSPKGWVVRVYEPQGQAIDSVYLQPAWTMQAASEVNLIEKESSPLEVDLEHNQIVTSLGAFEIKTFLLEFEQLANEKQGK